MECKDPFTAGAASTEGTGTSLGAQSTQANANQSFWSFIKTTATGATGTAPSACEMRVRCTFMLVALVVLFLVILWESRKGGKK